MSMETDAVLSDIKTMDGKFYVGMTREEAKEQGKSIFKKFTEIDSDERDGILSYDEIMKQRQKKEKRINTGKNIWCGIALLQIITSPWSLAKAEQMCTALSFTKMADFASSPKRYLVSALIQSLLFFGIAAGKVLKMRKLQKQDEKYWAQYQEVLKSTQQDDKTELEEKGKIDVTA